ncbi:MAG: 4Fe-4S binding protein [Campylobacteraceae bacterium]|nr:4Fe-4S binding protein [Campylobacteraceae bacterium]
MNGNLYISQSNCCGCLECVEACSSGAFEYD